MFGALLGSSIPRWWQCRRRLVFGARDFANRKGHVDCRGHDIFAYTSIIIRILFYKLCSLVETTLCSIVFKQIGAKTASSVPMAVGGRNHDLSLCDGEWKQQLKHEVVTGLFLTWRRIPLWARMKSTFVFLWMLFKCILCSKRAVETGIRSDVIVVFSNGNQSH